MSAKIQVRIVYLVVAIVLSTGVGIGIDKGYNAFLSAHQPEPQFQYFRGGTTLLKLSAADSEKDEQMRASAIRQALATDRAEFGRHGLIAYLNELPSRKEVEESFLKHRGFSAGEIANLLRPIA